MEKAHAGFGNDYGLMTPSGTSLPEQVKAFGVLREKGLLPKLHQPKFLKNEVSGKEFTEGVFAEMELEKRAGEIAGKIRANEVRVNELIAETAGGSRPHTPTILTDEVRARCAEKSSGKDSSHTGEFQVSTHAHIPSKRKVTDEMIAETAGGSRPHTFH